MRPACWHVGVGHLHEGVDPGIGARGPVSAHGDAREGGQGRFQAGLDAAAEPFGLVLPAREVRALVGQDEFEADGGVIVAVHGKSRAGGGGQTIEDAAITGNPAKRPRAGLDQSSAPGYAAWRPRRNMVQTARPLSQMRAGMARPRNQTRAARPARRDAMLHIHPSAKRALPARDPWAF